MLAAYDRRAISNLLEDHLLDFHIMAHAHELLGQPGRRQRHSPFQDPHFAFDNHLIGIDPDGRVHVSERLLMLRDGPLLEQSLKACAGASIRPPRGKAISPGPRRLATRFEQFKRIA